MNILEMQDIIGKYKPGYKPALIEHLSIEISKEEKETLLIFHFFY